MLRPPPIVFTTVVCNNSNICTINGKLKLSCNRQIMGVFETKKKLKYNVVTRLKKTCLTPLYINPADRSAQQRALLLCHMCTAAWRASAILSCLFSEVRLVFSRQTQNIGPKQSKESLERHFTLSFHHYGSIAMQISPSVTWENGGFRSVCQFILTWHIRVCDDCGKARKQTETIKLNLGRGSIHPGRVFVLRSMY